MRRVECETSSGSEAFLVSPVNFLAEMACFSSDVLLIFTVLICGCCGVELFFGPVYARFCFLPNSCVPTSFLDARVTTYGTNEGNEELSGNSGETEATVAKHMTRRTFVAVACGVVAAAACGPVTVTMFGCTAECRRFCVDVGRRRLARVVHGGLWRRNRCHAGQWLEAARRVDSAAAFGWLDSWQGN